MKVIFLDIDGVLNVYPQGRDDYGSIFHKHFVDNLRWIIEQTGAKIVISSTWRFSGLDIMIEMWKVRNLPGEVIGITPDFMHQTGTTLQRGKEIIAWIEEWEKINTKIKSYVIIDDDTDMEPEQLKNFVKTSGNTTHSDFVDGGGYGLTKECSQKVIDILNAN